MPSDCLKKKSMCNLNLYQTVKNVWYWGLPWSWLCGLQILRIIESPQKVVPQIAELDYFCGLLSVSEPTSWAPKDSKVGGQGGQHSNKEFDTNRSNKVKCSNDIVHGSSW